MNISIWSIDGTGRATINLDQSGPGSKGNEEVYHIPQISKRKVDPVHSKTDKRIKQCWSSSIVSGQLNGKLKTCQYAPVFEYRDNLLRCLRCNGYSCRKWTRRHEFKSWTRLIAFYIALIPLGKVWIQLFSLQLWINSRADWVLQP